MKKLLLTTTVIGAACVISVSGHAAPLGPLTSFSVIPDGGINVDITASPMFTGEAESGQIALTLTGLTSPLDVFCTDIFHDLTDGSYFVEQTLAGNGNGTSLSNQQLGEISYLINNYEVNEASSPFAGGNSYSGAQEFSSATQIAIWDVEYATNPLGGGDAGFSFISSDANLNGVGGDVWQLASDAMQANPLNGQDFAPTATTLIPTDVNGNPTGADQAQSFIPIGHTNNDEPPATVPEPLSIMLFGSGLLALGAVRRKRRA
jgi:hypothetical protein